MIKIHTIVYSSISKVWEIIMYILQDYIDLEVHRMFKNVPR